MQNGTKIQKARKANGLSQEKMADNLGMSQTKYSRIERNESDATITEVKKIAEQLGVDSSTDILSEGIKETFQNSFNQNGDNNGAVTYQSKEVLEIVLSMHQALINEIEASRDERKELFSFLKSKINE